MKKALLLLALLVFIPSQANAVIVSGTCVCTFGTGQTKNSEELKSIQSIQNYAELECFNQINPTLACSVKLNNTTSDFESSDKDTFINELSSEYSEHLAQEMEQGEDADADQSNDNSLEEDKPNKQVGANLPNLLGTKDPNVVFGRIISFIIGISGSFVLLMFIYGGVLWVISRGDQTMIKKGKDVIRMAVFGIFIIFVSYLIIKILITALGVIN